MSRAIAVTLAALVACTACAQNWQTGEIVRHSGADGNVIADASIETDAWLVSGGALLSAHSARTGQRGALIRREDDKTSPAAQSPSFPARPGPWLVSGWLRTRMPAMRDPNYSAVLDVRWLDAERTSLGGERIAAQNGVTHAWVYRERAVTAPPGTASGELVFGFNWSSTGLAELDDVAVTPLDAGVTPAAGVSLSLSAARRIFAPDEPLAVRATVRLAEGPERPVRLQMDVSDSRGRHLTSGHAATVAHSHRDTAVTIVAAPVQAPERERLVARVLTDPPTGPAQDFGLLVIPRPTDFSLQPTSPFAALEGHPYTARWLGVRWNRPNFNWNEREMELASRYGLNYVGMINEANAALEGRMSLEDYGRHVHESVSRVKHRVTYWQLGNEPNLYQPGVPEKWAEVLRVGYEAAKRADPACRVMWGGITALDVDPEMVDKLLAAGGGNYTDMIDVHLYVPIVEMDRLLAKVRADMAKHGVDKPIVITEVTATLGTAVPEREKAAHVYKRYAVAESHGVLASWWFVLQWVNTGEFRYCSLIDPGTGEPHEAAAAYSRLSAALEGARFVRKVDFGGDAWVYEWEKPGRRFYVAWAEGEGAGAVAALPCGTGTGTVTDVAGHQWDVRVAGGLTVGLRDEPLLCELPAGGSNGPQAPSHDLPQAPLSLARGASCQLPVPSFDGLLTVETPAGILASDPQGGALRLVAAPEADLGLHWLVVRHRRDDTDVGFLRQSLAVTPPVALDLRPLPGPGGSAAVAASVTNLSATPLSGMLTIHSPLSVGPRAETIQVPFSGLGAEQTGQIAVPLWAGANPAARYPTTMAVETAEGVRDELARDLVFAPAPRTLTPPAIDGDLSDWQVEFPITVGPDTGETSHPADGPPSSPADLSARAAVRWDEANLYLAVRVTDDVHRNDQTAGALWDGDGLQLGFAPEPYVPASAYEEWGVALTAAGVERWAWRAAPGRPTGRLDFPCGIVRGDGETLYELAIPWALLPAVQPAEGTVIGLGLCVNEKDGANRGHYAWHAGIATDKDRLLFGQVTLTGPVHSGP